MQTDLKKNKEVAKLEWMSTRRPIIFVSIEEQKNRRDTKRRFI